MKRLLKSSAGVTLLEIMLVLAIASMVIVMSIRYYQNATNSQNSNVILEQIEAITAAADNIGQGSGSYSGVGGTGTSGVSGVVGAKNMVTPYLTTITVTAGTGSSPTYYTVSVPMPQGVCAGLKTKLSANSRFIGATCSTTGLSYSYTYTTNS